MSECWMILGDRIRAAVLRISGANLGVKVRLGPRCRFWRPRGIAIGERTTLEGEEFNGRLVVIEFPDSRSARGFYDSREYQDLVRLRAPAACAEFVLAEGFPPAP